jgi:hypothetical protein
VIPGIILNLALALAKLVFRFTQTAQHVIQLYACLALPTIFFLSPTLVQLHVPQIIIRNQVLEFAIFATQNMLTAKLVTVQIVLPVN